MKNGVKKQFMGLLLAAAVTVPNIGINFAAPLEIEVKMDEVTSEGAVTAMATGEFSYAVNGGNIYYNSNGTITDCDETVVSAVIPEEIDGVEINSIGYDAFFNHRNLISISLPDSITSIKDEAFCECINLVSINMPKGLTHIGKAAFEDCESLTDISLPKGLISIGDDAFCGCWSLTDIYIPDSVTSIGTGAFSWCDSLSAIYVSDNNSVYTSIDGVLFTKDISEIVAYPENKDGDLNDTYNIPEETTCIGNSAFIGCDTLTGVYLHQGIVSIGNEAFFGCDSLTGITIPSSVTHIGPRAFGSCNHLKSISVAPDNMMYTSIDGALLTKDLKEFIACPGGWEGEYVVPSGVTVIGEDAFTCDLLTSVVFPDGVKIISDDAFSVSFVFESVSLPTSIEYIGFNAFGGCFDLKDVYYSGSEEQWDEIVIEEENDPLIFAAIHFNPIEKDTTETTTEEQEGIFGVEGGNIYYNNSGEISGCDVSVTSAVIPAVINGVNITDIAEYAFADCTNLVSISINKNVTKIADNAFEGCNNLTDVYVMKGSHAEQWAAEMGYNVKYIAFIYGDANADNLITAMDSASVLQKVLDASFVTGIEKAGGDYMTYLDVNADGMLTASDSSYILQKTLDNSFKMPCEE